MTEFIKYGPEIGSGICGLYMVYVWFMYGLYMVYMWFIYIYIYMYSLCMVHMYLDD